MLLAVGGTAGPPTGHMVVAARARSIHGPWENAPNNPIVRTQSASEKWWSRGHATLIEAPDRTWWMVYHGYENGFWTLGRQTLLDPVEWTHDGWLRARGGDLSSPLRKPRATSTIAHGIALSDNFSTNKFGVQWSFYDPAPNESQRVRYLDRTLILKAKGVEPRDSSPAINVIGSRPTWKLIRTRAQEFFCSTTVACIAASDSTRDAL
jgi:beta-xylosidase